MERTARRRNEFTIPDTSRTLEHSAAFSGLRLLVVEDDADDRVFTTRALSREFDDCSIEWVLDLAAFEAALEFGQFDLAITDYTLAWTEGLVVVRRLKS